MERDMLKSIDMHLCPFLLDILRYEFSFFNSMFTCDNSAKRNIYTRHFRFHVPVIFYLMFHLNNLFIVINSSFNFIICYFVAAEFRKQTTALFQKIKENCCILIGRINSVLRCLPIKKDISNVQYN